MTHLTFLMECLIPYWHLYLLSFIITLLIYLPIFKRFSNSIIDPACYALFSAVFADSVPLFLFILNRISTENFIYFLFAQGLFWLGFFLNYKKDVKFNHSLFYNDYYLLSSLYKLLFIALTICQITTFILRGIPLFNEDRLATYVDGGGLGILAYISNFAMIYCTIYSFFIIGKNKNKKRPYIVLFSIIVFSFFSGSKSAILLIVFCYYFYIYWYKGEKLSIGRFKKYIPIILFFPLLTLMLHNDSNFVNSIIGLWNRLISYGDGYWQAYPEDTINNVQIRRPFLYLFSRILAPCRIIDYSQVETVIGLQLNEILHPNNIDLIGGANTRIPVLSWVLFGWKGLILPFVLGVFTAFWKTKLPSALPNGILSVICYAYIYISLISIITDPVFASGKIFEFVVASIIFIVAVLFLSRGKIKIQSFKSIS